MVYFDTYRACSDCYQISANGSDGMDISPERLAAVEKGFADVGGLSSHPGEAENDAEFETGECEICGTHLAGFRGDVLIGREGEKPVDLLLLAEDTAELATINEPWAKAWIKALAEVKPEPSTLAKGSNWYALTPAQARALVRAANEDYRPSLNARRFVGASVLLRERLEVFVTHVPRETELDVSDAMLRSYLTTALWASTCYSCEGHDEQPCDKNHDVSDFDDEARAEARADIKAFINDQWVNLEATQLHLDDSTVAHNLFLNRNGHGAGFWDKGLGDAAERLSKAAKGLSTQEPDPREDGSIGWHN